MTPPTVADFSHLPFKESDQEQGLLSQLSLASQTNFNSHCKGFAIVRGLAWSPSLCSSTGGCILAVVTDDHRVRIIIRCKLANNGCLALGVAHVALKA